jgi:hypothetical protein
MIAVDTAAITARYFAPRGRARSGAASLSDITVSAELIFVTGIWRAGRRVKG